MVPRVDVLHLHPPGVDLPLLAAITSAGIVTAVLLGLALAALTRRQSRPYLHVALAIAALFARTVVAGLASTGPLPQTRHHLLEHPLDAAMAALVVGAVY